MQEVASPSIALKKRNDSIPARELARFFLPFCGAIGKSSAWRLWRSSWAPQSACYNPGRSKVVIDRVLPPSQHSRVPLLSAWLDHATLTPKEIIYGGCV